MKLTILMYHKVDELPRGDQQPGNYVAPNAFAEQMDALVAWGYESIAFDDWLSHPGDVRRLPRKPLIVTFDDGYTCLERNAWPVLKARGLGATVFLVSGQIGGTNAWDAGQPQERLLDTDRILVLQAEGVRFGSHSVTHKPLAHIPSEQAFAELTQSRAALRDVLGCEPEIFAYPFSNQSPAVRQLAREAGYRAAVRGKGRMNWPATDFWGLRRIKIEPTTTVEGLDRVLFRERYLRFF